MLYERIMASDARCAGVQCRMMNFSNREIIDSLGIQIFDRRFQDLAGGQAYSAKFQRRGRVLGLCAGAALYRREFFNEVGLFDERFFAGYEDVDLSLRGLRRGWYFLYEPEAIVYHHRSPTFDAMKQRKRLESRKNYFLLGYKNFPRQYLFKLTRELLYRLQKDLFNIVAHVRHGRFGDYWKMYATIFSSWRTVLAERRATRITREEFERILLQSEQNGIWQAEHEAAMEGWPPS
jgi:hypothetical protein